MTYDVNYFGLVLIQRIEVPTEIDTNKNMRSSPVGISVGMKMENTSNEATSCPACPQSAHLDAAGQTNAPGNSEKEITFATTEVELSG